MNINKKVKKVILILGVVLLIIGYYFTQLNWISITAETVYLKNLPEEFNDLKILQLTDLHNKEFGENNKRLVRKINKNEFDVIVITGDMLTNDIARKNTNNGEVLIKLLQNLDSSYPIYYVTGEHEEGLYYTDRNKYQKKGTKENYEDKLKELGVQVLNDEKVKLENKNASLNLYGLKDHLSGEIQIEKRLGKANKKEINILLSHRPHYFQEYSDWGADLVFSGDTHGGVIRIPFINKGVLSSEGFFPEYDGGLFEKEESLMIVGRGLGNVPFPLRINNRPEIVIVTLKRE